MPVKPNHDPAPVDLATESVAGEEDPGASIDLPDTPRVRGNPCPKCGGSGKFAGTTCPECQGSGKAGGDS